MKVKRGLDHWQAKVPDREIRIMRALRAIHGCQYRQIGDYFSVHWRTVADLVNYKTRESAGVPDGSDCAEATRVLDQVRSSRLKPPINPGPGVAGVRRPVITLLPDTITSDGTSQEA